VPFIDFGALKERVSMEQAMQLLGLQLRPHGHQLRGPCPVCRTGGDRALVVTPGKQLFYCFAGKIGGDQIALVAHLRACKTQEAAAFLDGNSTVPSTVQNGTVSKKGATIPPAPKERGFGPLTYLEPHHEALQALGVSRETAEAFESGYAPKGVLRGRYAVPVKSRTGELLAYAGIAVTKEQTPQLLFHTFDPSSHLFNADRVAEGGDLWVCRDPLAAILAVENGIPIENVVSFLAPITAQSLEMLSSLLDERKVESCDFV
jgi:DNA primase